MAARGEISPMPDCAIFADTKAEPETTYRHLEWLQKELPFPVHRVSAGDLRAQIVGAMQGRNRMDGRPPFFTSRGGMLRRQCTHDFKIRPIVKKIRELIGLRVRSRGPKHPVVQEWLGITIDEAVRVKPSRFSYIEHRWPLIEMKLSRNDCIQWFEKQGYEVPQKSACTFCPFRDDAAWLALKQRDPSAFSDAVQIDETIRAGVPGRNRPDYEQWFVHRSRQPLAEVNFSQPKNSNLLLNECEGRCGI